jgi:hypothetical protein
MATPAAAPAAQTDAPAAAPDAGAIGRLGAQKQKWKAQAKKLVAERDALKAQLEEANKSGGAAKIAELEGKLREVKHRARFDELAKAAGAKDGKALDDLWEKSGYKAEGEAPDPAKINAAIEAQKAERDYLFAPAGQEQGQQGQQPQEGFNPLREAPKPGPGRGQGGHGGREAGAFQATQEQLRDPAWCFANQAKLAEVAKRVGGLPVNQVANKFAIV